MRAIFLAKPKGVVILDLFSKAQLLQQSTAN